MKKWESEKWEKRTIPQSYTTTTTTTTTTTFPRMNKKEQQAVGKDI